jgi:hypothetical protein
MTIGEKGGSKSLEIHLCLAALKLTISGSATAGSSVDQRGPLNRHLRNWLMCQVPQQGGIGLDPFRP